MTDLARLQRIEALARRWAELHAAHYVATTINEPDRGPGVPRSVYLAAEQALLDAVRGR